METMTINEVCKVLRISPAAARNRLSQKLPMPPSFKVGRSRLFVKTEFYEWVETHMVNTKKTMPDETVKESVKME